MRWWSTRQPRCCSKAENKSNSKTSETPWTTIHGSRACLRRVAGSRDSRAFAEIESAVAAGLSAAGFFSYECGNCFEPKAAMRAEPRGPAAGVVRDLRAQLRLRPRRPEQFIDGEPPELGGFVRTAHRERARLQSCRTAEKRRGFSPGELDSRVRPHRSRIRAAHRRNP